MSQGQNKALAISLAIKELPALMQDAQNIFGDDGDGSAKNKLVTDSATLLLGDAATLATAQNPTLAPVAEEVAPSLLSFFSGLISRYIKIRKATGNPVKAVVPATPDPSPAS